MSNKSTLPQSVDEIEALAAVRALLFAKDIGASSIILEGNLKYLIFKALFCDNASFASFGHLIDKTIFC